MRATPATPRRKTCRTYHSPDCSHATSHTRLLTRDCSHDSRRRAPGQPTSGSVARSPAPRARHRRRPRRSRTDRRARTDLGSRGWRHSRGHTVSLYIGPSYRVACAARMVLVPLTRHSPLTYACARCTDPFGRCASCAGEGRCVGDVRAGRPPARAGESEMRAGGDTVQVHMCLRCA